MRKEPCQYCPKQDTCLQSSGGICECKHCKNIRDHRTCLPSEMFPTISNLDKKEEYVISDIILIKEIIKDNLKKFNEFFKNKKSRHFNESIIFLEKIKDTILKTKVEKKQKHFIFESTKLIDALCDKIVNQKCHLCQSKLATTTEHIFKNSLLKKYQPKSVGEKLHYNKDGVRTFENSESLVTGQPKDLCEDCNNKFSKSADYNFEKMFDGAYQFLITKHRKNSSYEKNSKLIDLVVNTLPKDSEKIMNFIYSFSPREEIKETNVSYDDSEVKRYLSKIIACQVGRENVPSEVRDMFFNKQNLEKLNYKIFNLQYNFNDLDTVFVKSGVWTKRPKVNDIYDHFKYQIKGVDSVIFEIALGPLIIQVDYGNNNYTPEEYHRLYENDSSIVEKWKKISKSI